MAASSSPPPPPPPDAVARLSVETVAADADEGDEDDSNLFFKAQ